MPRLTNCAANPDSRYGGLVLLQSRWTEPVQHCKMSAMGAHCWISFMDESSTERGTIQSSPETSGCALIRYAGMRKGMADVLAKASIGLNSSLMCSLVSVCVPWACGLKFRSLKLTAPPSATEPIHPSDRTGSAVAGPLYQARGSPVCGLTGTLRSKGVPSVLHSWPLCSNAMLSLMGLKLRHMNVRAKEKPRR